MALTIAEARRGAPARRWVPHAAMGAVMASMHLMGETLLWACGAGLAAAAVWSGLRGDDSERLRGCRADLASCAILLCAWAGRQGFAGPPVAPMSMPMSMHTHHEGSPAPHAVAVLVALLTVLAWSVARSVIHLRECHASHPAPRVARATGPLMVPLMAAMVIWA